MKRKPSYDLHLAKQYLAESELQVAEQKERITVLRKQGRPTDQARRTLKGLEMTVVKLRNHLHLMQALLQPDHSSET